jgi:lysophospholipase L1-like esterase
MCGKSSNSQRPIRIKTGKKVLFSCLIALALLALIEITCRLAGVGKRQQTHQDIANWQLQWKSDFYVFDAKQVDPRFGVNQDGLRDRDHAVAADDGTRRVVCLGDSVTYGYGVQREESYPSYLEKELNNTASFEVFNVALPGWSTRQQRIAYERIARRYRPDYVILGVCLNDIAEMQNNLAGPPPRFLGTLYRYSSFARFLLPGHQREIHQVEELFTAQHSDRVQQAWELISDEIKTIAQLVAADGGQFGLFLFPFQRQVLADPPPAIPQEKFRLFCQQRKIQYWDGQKSLADLGVYGFIDYDHLSARGGLAVARQIAQSKWITNPTTTSESTEAHSSRSASP